nr:hypothetical protein BaRGS_026584 [Batillaria attramentaria]
MKELSFLTLSKNPLKSLDDILSKNLHLSYLDLSECRLETVPSGLPWATRHLQLGQNNITKLTKDTFKGTRYLGIIILDENQIAEIDPGTFLPIVHLQQLWLNGNKLTSFPSPIPVNIEMLCIERNAITAIATDDFPVKSKLKQLSLKGNKITEIGPFTFSHLAGLQKLYLGGNAIAELKDRSFHGLRNLTVLEIGRNPITHIETRFAAGMHMLKTLDMSFIEDTEPFVKGNFFRDTPYLTSLDLRYSPFLARNILGSTDTLKSLWSLENLNLMDNGLETVTADLHRIPARHSGYRYRSFHSPNGFQLNPTKTASDIYTISCPDHDNHYHCFSRSSNFNQKQ